jgi:cytochrome c peroxidase
MVTFLYLFLFTFQFPLLNRGANAGLKVARDFLEPLKKKYGISYGDLWTLAGATAVEMMGGPEVPWRAGRKDLDQTQIKALPEGRLPNADMGCPTASNSHVRDIFGRMGFNDRETVALLGAHSTGRCHTEGILSCCYHFMFLPLTSFLFSFFSYFATASGYWGPWTNAESTFSNEFFRLLLEEKWTAKKTHNGQPWKGPMQFETSSGAIMMLPADLWLVEDPEFRKVVELYAKDEQAFFKDFAAAFGKLLELGVKF